MTFKPMLADPPEHEKHPLRFPFLGSCKLDGIRCIITEEGARTRSLKPIPNKALAQALNALPPGLDGELIAGDAFGAGVMQRTTSAVMSVDGNASAGPITFHVFDRVDDWSAPLAPYSLRMIEARRVVERIGAPWVRFVPHSPIPDFAALMEYEAFCERLEYEGAMLRDPHGLYKFGRSTPKEQGLLKLKRWTDAEGAVLDAFEGTTNTNEQTRDERGYAKRSSAKGGKVLNGTLGGFTVALEGWRSATVDVGNGWTARERAELWEQWCANPGRLLGRLLKYKYQAEGSKDAPRIPVFIGFRHEDDL